MRRMIAQKQAQGLKKLNENIVVNDIGTQVNIGGFVIVEDIESIRVLDSNGYPEPIIYFENGHLFVYDGEKYVEFAPVEP